ncbi:unnamed protein product, partial [Polarella glacialis]
MQAASRRLVARLGRGISTRQLQPGGRRQQLQLTRSAPDLPSSQSFSSTSLAQEDAEEDPGPIFRGPAPGRRFRLGFPITALGKQSRWQTAVAMLTAALDSHSEDADLVALNAAAGACARGLAPATALLLLDEAGRRRLGPDVFTYSAAISAHERAGLWQAALSLFEELLGRTAPGSHQRSRDLGEDAVDRGLEPDLVVYNVAIAACEKGRRWFE